MLQFKEILFNFKQNVGLLSLIAKSESGYKRIVELSSKSYLNKEKNIDPQCSFKDLIDEPKDIILLSGSINGLIGKLFNKGKFSEIEEIYKFLKEQLETNVYFFMGDINEETKSKFSYLKESEIILLENIRFFKEEGENDDDFAKKLASLGDIYINDAFSCSHRKQASISKSD